MIFPIVFFTYSDHFVSPCWAKVLLSKYKRVNYAVCVFYKLKVMISVIKYTVFVTHCELNTTVLEKGSRK